MASTLELEGIEAIVSLPWALARHCRRPSAYWQRKWQNPERPTRLAMAGRPFQGTRADMGVPRRRTSAHRIVHRDSKRDDTMLPTRL
jgi:hypothetical protein